jgi:hypothetical protein
MLTGNSLSEISNVVSIGRIDDDVVISKKITSIFFREMTRD